MIAHPDVEIMNAYCELRSSDKLGDVSYGELKISGLLVLGRLRYGRYIINEYYSMRVELSSTSGRYHGNGIDYLRPEGKLNTDCDIRKEGPGRIMDGGNIYCLLMGSIISTRINEGEILERGVGLGLRRSTTNRGTLERIGVLVFNTPDQFFKEAQRQTVIIT